MSIASGTGAVLGTTSGIANLANSLATRLGGSAGSYAQQLRAAYFRNVPFVVLGGENSFGRRTQLHEYPLRDDVWVEDLGRGTRRIRVTGFLIGDDVIQQRDSLMAACETEGPGSLIHPTLGLLTDVSVIEARSIERWETGRYIELELAFVQGGERLFPSSSADTLAGVISAVTGLNVSAALDFASSALTTLSAGAAVIGTAVSVAYGWYSTARNLVGDARNLFRLLTNLPGDFGRFSGASTIPTFSPYPSSSYAGVTSDQLIANATVTRDAVAAAGATLNAAANTLSSSSISTFSDAAQGVVASVMAATTDPSDTMRLLTSLASYTPTGATTSSAVGVAMAGMQSACGDLFRRACVAALAQASSSYQPSSSDDAAAVRQAVTSLIDHEIRIAGDQGQDETYGALKTLRAAVVADLNSRGAGLAAIKSFQFAGSLPALVLANRIYRDVSRSDELVEQANPVHPAFMPQSFKALGV